MGPTDSAEQREHPDPAADQEPQLDPSDFAARFLPMLERPGGPSAHELEEFCSACYADGVVVVFDWIEWRDQANVLLETSGAMERTSLEELRQLLTMLIRQERFAEGTLAHAVERGWLHAILAQMRTLGTPSP